MPTTADIIKSLKWIQFNIGKAEPHTFEAAINHYVAAAILQLEHLQSIVDAKEVTK